MTQLSPATKKHVDKDGPGAFRREAEKKLKKTPESPEIPGGGPEKIIHELRVHQIELEMQNEALREARLELEESRDRYMDLYEFAPVGYLTLTNHGVIEEGNMTFASLLGVDRHSLIRDRFGKFVAPEDLEQWGRHFTSVLRSAEKHTCDLHLLKRDGSRVFARVESLRVDRDKKDPVVRMALIDISARKKAEDELARKSADLQVVNEELTAAGNELKRNEAYLTASLEEKEVLLAEIHHRVKNNLAAFISLLALDGTYEETPVGQRLKTDLQNRARSMALIHETLYKTRKFSSVDMGVYITTLSAQIAGTYRAEKSVRIIVDADNVSLDLARATPAGLIVNEILTNSLKYAFPPSFDCKTMRREPCTLWISLSLSNGTYSLSVRDNGIGLPPDFDPLTAKSLGLRLVNFLARHQLQGAVEIFRDQGTEFRIRFADEFS